MIAEKEAKSKMEQHPRDCLRCFHKIRIWEPRTNFCLERSLLEALHAVAGLRERAAA